jgi:hypothetical protein
LGSFEVLAAGFDGRRFDVVGRGFHVWFLELRHCGARLLLQGTTPSFPNWTKPWWPKLTLNQLGEWKTRGKKGK